jgi:hypothetical protein
LAISPNMYGECRIFIGEIHHTKAYVMVVVPFLSNGVVVFGEGIAGWLECAGHRRFIGVDGGLPASKRDEQSS